MIKGSSSWIWLIAALVLATAMTGCKKRPVPITPIPETAPPINTGVTPGPPRNVPPNPNSGGTLPANSGGESTPIAYTPDNTLPLPEGDLVEGMIPDPDVFSEQTVYFDFDSAVVRLSERDKVESVAAYLQNEPQTKVLVEGHCDERGTDEYNRALGERRALSIREFLANLGIAPERLTTISYGEDDPADPGHDELAWSRNRRGEFVLLRPPQ